MTKIVVLDIDGPMIPHRAYMMAENHGTIVSHFDPIAVMMVRRLLAFAPAKLVISSTWRGGGKERMLHLLGKNGFPEGCLHGDWATTPLNANLRRWEEIQTWLNRHPETTHYAALDDDPIEELPGGVVCSFENGLEMKHFDRAGKLLAIDDKVLHVASVQDMIMREKLYRFPERLEELEKVS
jgi:hypothetical protein